MHNSNYNITVAMSQWINDSPDDTLDGLQPVLPEIEQQLRNQIQPQLEDQFEKKIKEQVAEIQKMGEIQFQQALEDLEAEMRNIEHQKLSELDAELNNLKSQKDERDKVKLMQAQQRFVQEHFHDRILAHPSMQQLKHNIQDEITKNMMDKYNILRQKRVKELKVRLQSREQKDRIQTDKSIRNDVYSKSGLDEIKGEISKFKISLASLKSKYNLKISKITTEIKELSKKCQDTEYSNSNQLIDQLQREISELKLQIQPNYNQQKEIASEEESSFFFNQRGNNFSLGDNMAKGNFLQPDRNKEQENKYIEGAQYINQDIDIDSEDSLDQMTSSERKEQEQIPLPPNSHAQMLKRLLVEENSENEQKQSEYESNQVYLQMPMKTLLNFNVAKMLRDQWQEDSFDKYLSLRNTKQNNMNAQNQQPQNNFQSLYEQHLQKLNRDLKVPKRKKLTEKAKMQISLNFASQRHKNSESYF